MKTDPRVDAYLAKRTAPFAQPILAELRRRLHQACPDVEETLKWSAPAFLYKGKTMCLMAAFKAHATFGFFHGTLVTGRTGVEQDAMGSFGKLRTIADLPDEEAFSRMIATAMDLIDRGVKTTAARAPKSPKPALPVPPALQTALDANPAAAATFEAFAPGQRREYIEWIAEAKRDETRQRRVAQAIEWIAEGKTRNWKYQNC